MCDLFCNHPGDGNEGRSFPCNNYTDRIQHIFILFLFIIFKLINDLSLIIQCSCQSDIGPQIIWLVKVIILDNRVYFDLNSISNTSFFRRARTASSQVLVGLRSVTLFSSLVWQLCECAKLRICGHECCAKLQC